MNWMIEPSDYRIVPLNMTNFDEIVDWFLTFSRMASVRSGIRQLHYVFGDHQKEKSDPMHALEIHYLNRSINLFNRLAEPDQIGFFRLIEEKSIIQDVVDFANWQTSQKVETTEVNSYLYLSCQIYVSSLYQEEKNPNLKPSIEIMDFFRICLYLPTMMVQYKKQKLAVARHSQSNTLIFSSIKMAMPTIQYFANKSTKFPFEANLLVGQPEKFIRHMISGYFVFPLLTMVATLDEGDLRLVPSVWQHSSLIEHREIPLIDEHFQDQLDFLETHRKYALPIEGVEIICKNYGDIRSVYLKEKEYRHFENLRSLFAKITFSDNTEDLIAISLTQASILISSYHDIYELQEDRYASVVLKLFIDFVCSRPQEQFIHAKNKRIGFRYIDAQKDRESIIYLPRSVAGHTHQQLHSINKGTSPIPHFVRGHLRKLPPHRQASAQAKQLARSFGFDLPRGYTFISPYETGKSKTNMMETKRQIKKGDEYLTSNSIKQTYVSILKKKKR